MRKSKDASKKKTPKKVTKKSNRLDNVFKKDGWTNTYSSLGQMGKDRTTANAFLANAKQGEGTLSALYQCNGIARRIIDLVADEMTRNWFSINGDPEDLVISHLETINAKAKFRDLIKWARIYGGALAYIGVDDGGDLEQPINEDAIRDVKFLQIYDRHCISWSSMDLYDDPKKDKDYGMPRIYTINPIKSGSPFKIHESRTFRIEGESLPDRISIENNGWGESVFMSCMTELANLGSSYLAVANILQDFIQTVIKIEGLGSKISADDDDWIRAKLDTIDKSRSVANTVLLDAQEIYEKHSSTTSGLDQLMDRFALAVASVVGIPYSLLMGQSPSGLNATGDTELRLFYDKIRGKQEEQLQPALEKLTRLIMMSSNGPFGGVEPEEWKIEFNPLWQMDANQEANYRKTIADTMAVYIDRNVLDPSEVAISLFGGDKYSSEIQIDKASREVTPPPTQEETQQYQQEQANLKAEAANNGAK